MPREPSISERALAAFRRANARNAEADPSIHWVTAGQDRPVVFVQPSPTSSFVGRKVFSRLSEQRPEAIAQFTRDRLKAPDQ